MHFRPSIAKYLQDIKSMILDKFSEQIVDDSVRKKHSNTIQFFDHVFPNSMNKGIQFFIAWYVFGDNLFL